MKKLPHCLACQKPFIPGPHNRQRQRFCSDPACQRTRRSQQQRQRRSQPPEKQPVNVGGFNTLALAQRAEAAVKPSEARLLAFHPVFIGLASQMLASSDPEEILTFIRRLWSRGNDILHAPPVPKLTKGGLL